MGAPINRVESWTASDYDMIIDVRSPAEFADDHLPGAVNLPVLDNDQRAEIGTMYKQISPFAAKRAGAALVAGNIAQHIGSALKDADRNFRPLVYCWRGGQRSGAMARIFSEIGWQTDLVDGGYKRYRKQVLDGLNSLPQRLNLVVLRGRTGLAKTHILQAALARGAQVIDLEALANHRGSLLGPEPDGEQPPQRLFESHLHAVLCGLDPARPVFIEAESNKVGQIHVPAALWAAMRGAVSVVADTKIEYRVAFLCRDYAHIIAEPARLDPLLDWVVTRLGHDIVDGWRQLIAAGDWPGFVRAVLDDHYDPAYDKSAAQRNHEIIATLDAGALDAAAIDRAANQLLALRPAG
ncbi:MAG: tRNA 2-selenouridine(34) synthase MnmH [Candidatus Puniceispirillaceae bacterium]